MYDSWANFYNTGNTYAYMDYKKSQKKTNELKSEAVMENGSQLKR